MWCVEGEAPYAFASIIGELSLGNGSADFVALAAPWVSRPPDCKQHQTAATPNKLIFGANFSNPSSSAPWGSINRAFSAGRGGASRGERLFQCGIKPAGQLPTTI